VTKIGVFRNATGAWYLDNFNNHNYLAADQTFVYGSPGQTRWLATGMVRERPNSASSTDPHGCHIEGPKFTIRHRHTFSYGNSSMQCLVGH